MLGAAVPLLRERAAPDDSTLPAGVVAVDMG
jgi:hypothetical protein